MRLGAAVLALALAGSACEDGGAPDTALPASDADADDLGDFAAAPEWSAEEMTAAAQAMLELGFPNPKAPYDAYMSLLSFRDEVCPGEGDQLVGQEMAQGGCTASTGAHYEGNTTLLVTDESGGDVERRSFSLGGDFLIEDPEGYRLAGGGGMSYGISRAGSGQVDWFGESAGTWIHDRRDDWLGLGISSTVTFGGSAGGDNAVLTLDGSLGLDGVYVQFVDLTWRDGCDAYPQGSVRMRDPSGLWSTLDLADRCDGCGAWSIDGLGEPTEACLDLRPYGSAIAELGTW